jgi:hypothetical protein
MEDLNEVIAMGGRISPDYLAVALNNRGRCKRDFNDPQGEIDDYLAAIAVPGASE